LGHATQLYDDLSVRDNVRFSVRAGGGTLEQADAALGLVGLTGRLADTPAARLSAGQRRRTALASVVARRPELWLLDEPYAGLDADARVLLDGLVSAAVAGGAGVIIASHEAGQVEELAQRTVTVAGGRTTESVLVP